MFTERSLMARTKRVLLLLGLCSLVELARAVCEEGGEPIACTPPHEENILAGLEPVASDSCGQRGPEKFCYQTTDGRTRCDYCDASVAQQGHPPSLMTDPRHDVEGGNLTFWLSFRSSAVVTFPLSKKFEISSVSVSFFSSRPESYAIYKSADYGETFVPFQYFSLSCEATYGVAESSDVDVGEEDVALCTSAGAGGTSSEETIFRPLEHLPGDLADSKQLQEWVLATHIQLRFDRQDAEAQFYAVSNVEVSGTCYCNGHARTCSGSVAAGDVTCECEHGTDGRDCGECLDFYQDVPWGPATIDNPTSCAACNCNNHSDVCCFDVEVYVASGNVSGGVCESCRDNTEGEQCQRCTLGYYPSPSLPLASPDYCTLCDCDPRGMVGGEASCLLPPSVSPASPASQSCQCKTNVEEEEEGRCSQCKTGFHQLSLSDPDGCQACPACYDQVYLEFNKTQSLLSSLLSHLNSTSPGQLPGDLLQEISDYRLILEDMLTRATLLARQERNLTSRLSVVATETDDLEDLIGRLERNVSLSEEGLGRIAAESGPAVVLLGRLTESLEAVETAVRVDLVTSLSRASKSLQEIDSLFSQIVNLSREANQSSFDHRNLALDLLSSATESLVLVQQALDLLSLTISLQNTTSLMLEGLSQENMRLDSIFTDASSDLPEAQLTVAFAVDQSTALLERLNNVTISDYDTRELEERLEALRNATQDLDSDSGVVSGELRGVESEVEEVRERAGILLAESATLNLLSVELLARAHAALSFANQTVEEGSEFVASVEEILTQLQLRLGDSSGFVSGLEEVVQNILVAEELVNEAEGEEGRRRGEVREAVREAEEAVKAFEDASQLTTQALEAALRVREEATNTLFNATLLASQAEELSGNVSAAEERGAELEAVSTETEELITTATEAAQTASSDASRLQEEIQQLLGVLDELKVDLDSTELLPSNRLSEVGSLVTELEAQADSNQVTLDALQDQVGQLEASSGELRERHRNLQQHRDLLQSILDNIQRLDCRNQFQSI